MTDPGDVAYLRHMMAAADRVCDYVLGVSLEDFRQDPKTQDAVIRQLEVLGEAASNISKDFCSAHPEIPWSKISGMRHRLIHGYMSVDLDLVWRTATNRVPELRSPLRALVELPGR